ncbi:hypothetical protein [Cecembia rubra]|uniref:hypothetical protein n=1 Tax=Cecembia rubra TaxID=1485585 RepID=UPI000D0D24FA|nr:hypothetical protein [Cecembia rubra]
METLFSLILLTVFYGMLILAIFPEKYFRKLSHFNHHKRVPDYLKVSLSTPIFFSFLMGYTLAATMLYFFQGI